MPEGLNINSHRSNRWQPGLISSTLEGLNALELDRKRKDEISLSNTAHISNPLCPSFNTNDAKRVL